MLRKSQQRNVLYVNVFSTQISISSESTVTAHYVALNLLCVCSTGGSWLVCVLFNLVSVQVYDGENVCIYLCICVCTSGGRGAGALALVKSLPVALFRVVLQLHADAANALQQHGCAVVTIHDSGVDFDFDADVLVGLAQQQHLLTQNSLLLGHVLARHLQTSLWCRGDISDPEVWTGHWRWTHILPQSWDLGQGEHYFIAVLCLQEANLDHEVAVILRSHHDDGVMQLFIEVDM